MLYYNPITMEQKLFMDGMLLRTDIELILPGNGGQNLRIGMPDTIDSTDDPWNGLIDEVRVSHNARDENWIQTEYNNQVNPSSFYLIGPQEFS